MLKHNHHKLPRHAGGTDDPENMEELTVEEHAEAHRVLYELYGRKQDWLAWKGLSGQIGHEEILLELYRDNGRRVGASNKGREAWNKGLPGRKWTEEEKQLASVKRKGKKKPPGFGTKVSAAMTGKKKSKLHATACGLAKRDQTIYTFRHKDGREFKSTRWDQTFLTSGEVTNLLTGWQKTAKGWSIQ